jgi:hypothetical protein
MDLSFDALFAAGGSNQRDPEIQNLQGGGHDPRKRGFTVQNVELQVNAAVDPYFEFMSNIVWFIDPNNGETSVELEEAYATTTSLPEGLQVKAGQFFTEFGRINPQHPHSWDFLDQPVINTRIFGPDGLRNPGLRVSWLMPLPFYSEIIAGVQNANGETASSFYANEEIFAERPVGNRQFVEQDARNLGDYYYTLRWAMSGDPTPELTVLWGLSALFGPNATGEGGQTRIYGTELRFKWLPSKNERGWPFVTWLNEFIYRDYKAAAQEFDPDATPGSGDEFIVDSDDLRDYGINSSLIWGFSRNWAVGTRFEWAGGSGDTVDPATGADVTASDPWRDDRIRATLLLAWKPTAVSRLRLQYTFDRADHLKELDDRYGHSVWLGLEVMIGAHAAHAY